ALSPAPRARRIGISTGAILFPQPASAPAQANLAALLAADCDVIRIRSWAELPAMMAVVARGERRAGDRAFVMARGGAAVEGAFGGLSAAYELADQIATGAL